MASSILYQFPPCEGQGSLSTFCVKVQRALYLKGVDFEVRNLQLPWEVARVNPKVGKLPVLEINGERIGDSSRILRWLDTNLPGPALRPKDANAAARVHALESWADEALYWFVVHQRWQVAANYQRFLRSALGQVPGPLRWLLGGTTRRGLRRALWAQGLGRMSEAQVSARLELHLDSLDELVRGGEWLVGDTPSAADVAVFALLQALHAPLLPSTRALIQARSHIVDWAQRVDAISAGPSSARWG